MTDVIVIPAKVDRIRLADRPALERMFSACSLTTVHRRFFAPLRAFPSGYLAGALAGPPAVHDATVLRYGDGAHIAGLASFVARADAAVATVELGVLVRDAWQGRGFGTALVQLLVGRAAERGVERMVASVLPERAGLLSALSRRLEVVDMVAEDDCLTGVYRIDRGGSA